MRTPAKEALWGAVVLAIVVVATPLLYVMNAYEMWSLNRRTRRIREAQEQADRHMKGVG